MKKHTEKPPIDELFARKIGNMSLPPSPNGFERLQARMGKHQPEGQIVFWRNSDLQRYMAVAACLLLVCLFGWLYWPSEKTVMLNGQQVATSQSKKSHPQKPGHQQVDLQSKKSVAETVEPNLTSPETGANQVAIANKSAASRKEKGDENSRLTVNPNGLKTPEPEHNKPVLAQVESVKNPNKTDIATLTDQRPPINQAVTEQVAENKPVIKPAQPSERVLVVTIDEPEALVAARQVAKESAQEKPAVAISEKLPKESKGGSFWKQVKRIREGEVFARRENPDNDEQGLLGRAYNGLKQSFDKDKSTKQ